MQNLGRFDLDLLYLDISDATEGDLTVDPFYETFKDNNTEPGFRTLLKLWPVP